MTSAMPPSFPSANKPILFRIDGTQSARRRRRSDKCSFWQERAFNGATEMRRRLFPESGELRDVARDGARQRDRRREGNCGSGIRASDARDSVLFSVMLSCFTLLYSTSAKSTKSEDGTGAGGPRRPRMIPPAFFPRESIVDSDVVCNHRRVSRHDALSHRV